MKELKEAFLKKISYVLLFFLLGLLFWGLLSVLPVLIMPPVIVLLLVLVAFGKVLSEGDKE